jgi:ZIP family zinc transporter
MVGVMTLHSFAEGLGIGASFCGPDGTRLGTLISATLAVHNVPEGLAVALVLIPRGVSPLRTTLACVATSLPQPIVAAPAFLFLDACSAWRAAGLGFAGGAMVWVAAFELLPDAARALPAHWVTAAVAAAFAGMQAVSAALDAGTRPL